jgi:hypothetical protein
MPARRFVTGLVATLLVVILAAPAGAWSSVKVADNGSDPEAAFRPGRTAITYVEHFPGTALPQSVVFAYLEGSVWRKQKVQQGDISFGEANPQLALEADLTPWVFFELFSFPDESALRFRDDAGVWTHAVSIPDAAPLDLKILPDGLVAMLHRPTDGSPGLSYSTYDPLTQNLQTDEITPDEVFFASLAIRSGIPSVAFDGPDGVSWAILDGITWDVELVDAADNPPGNRPSLAYSLAGAPRMAYSTPAGLKFAFRNGSGVWVRKIVDPNSTALNASMRTTSQGPAQIAYTTGSSTFALKWAVSTSSGWTLSTVFPNVGGPHLGEHSLVGVGDGTPRIAYTGVNVVVRWARP